MSLNTKTLKIGDILYLTNRETSELQLRYIIDINKANERCTCIILDQLPFDYCAKYGDIIEYDFLVLELFYRKLWSINYDN